MTDEIRAAGGVVFDQSGRVVIVHRPGRDDWSLPKGKCDPGESDDDAARREVFEETGVQAEILGEIGEVRYVDARGRPKRARYYLMRGEPGGFEPGEEVDEIRWVEPERARTLVTYATDRELIQRAAEDSRI